MLDDDAPRGTLLSRRETFLFLGTAMFAPRALAACIVRPEQTMGPFFADAPRRADIRAGKPGVPLQLTLNVSQLAKGNCAPLAGAQVDLWHCDAEGVYSDDTFLRGYQTTDGSGTVRFTTIYPGWYSGRAVHIHVRIRGAGEEFASQLYFEDAVTDRVHARALYASRGGRRVRNDRDGMYRDGGERLMLALTENAGGFAAAFDVAVARG